MLSVADVSASLSVCVRTLCCVLAACRTAPKWARACVCDTQKPLLHDCVQLLAYPLDSSSHIRALVEKKLL